jgi:hypothetical protein
MQPFKLKTEERPTNFEKIKKGVEDELQDTLKFNMKYHKPLKAVKQGSDNIMNAFSKMPRCG